MYEVQMIPIGQIAENPFNPRKTFLDMEDLVEDVKKRGILQPVLVRPTNEGKGYELVFGARRYRAAKGAKLEAVPAMVRILPDDEALELMIVENCKRQDIHPLEEADGYRQLHEKHGHAIEDIAAKVGKSKAYVYARMKLCALEASARKAFVEGMLSPSVALLVARMPKDLQAKATKDLTHQGWGNPRRPLEQPMTFREAAELLERGYMLRLAEAPFPTADPELVAKAGPCTTCPKRTGNQRELFGDVKNADVCIDPPCFKQKAEAFWERQKADAEREGHRVLSEAETKKAFQYGRLRHGSGLVDLSERCHEDPKGRTYQQLLRKAPPVEKAVARDDEGKVRELAKAPEVAKALKEAGHTFRSSTSGRSSSISAADKRRAAQSKLQKKVAHEAIAVISAKAATKAPDVGLWRLLAVLAEASLGSTPSKAVLGRWGLKVGGERWNEAHSEKFLRTLKETVNEQQARALLLELFLEDCIQFMGVHTNKYPAGLSLAAEYFGVDIGELANKAAAETSLKKPAKKARKK